MIIARKPVAMAQRPRDETPTSILRTSVKIRRGELWILQKAQNDTKHGQNHLRYDSAQLAVAADRKSLEEVGHHHHGADIGTIESDQRANVVDPITNAPQSLVDQLSIGVVGLNFLVVVLRVKLGNNTNRMVFNYFLIQLNKLPGG